MKKLLIIAAVLLGTLCVVAQSNNWEVAAVWQALLAFEAAETTAPAAHTGWDRFYGDSTAHALKLSNNGGSFFNVTQTIVSGTGATAGTAIGAGTSQTLAITVTGALVTDVATCSTNAAYPATWLTGITVLPPVVTANTVTLTLTNPSAGSITPAAQTFRCTVTR